MSENTSRRISISSFSLIHSVSNFLSFLKAKQELQDEAEPPEGKRPTLALFKGSFMCLVHKVHFNSVFLAC